jgi:hypothetical protein
MVVVINKERKEKNFKRSSEMRKRMKLFFLVVFLLFWLIAGTGLARGQTEAWVTVEDTYLASGKTNQLVTVFLENDVPIQGFLLDLYLDSPSVADFTTDTIEIDTLSVPGETLVVRYCKLETEGTLTENFFLLSAHGEAGDPALLDCDWVRVFWTAEPGQPIPPGAGVLFKLYVDVLCIPDTTEDRLIPLLISPFPISNLSDPEGYVVETEFFSGTVFADYTVCGNLMECVCGDVNADGDVNIVDVTYMISYLLKSGPDLCPELMGDVDLYRGVSISDIVYLINYVLKSGPEPVCTRTY